MTNSSSIVQLRRDAQAQQNLGKYAAAVELQIQVINSQGGYNASCAEDMHILGLYLFQLGDIAAAESVLKEVYRFDEQDVSVAKNLAICRLKQGNHESAIALLTHCLELEPDNFESHDVLAHAAGISGNLALAVAHGQSALRLKDNAACAAEQRWPRISGSVKPFSRNDPSKNIIAFSLWGTQSKYLDGAIQNAKLAKDIYPSWRCRFYLDESVPVIVHRELLAHGAQLVTMPKLKRAFAGLFWRFLVADDPTIERFLIRDCDAVINIRESAAVDLWCGSDKHFHLMRDFYTHTELVLAGMWGGVIGTLPKMQEAYNQFLAEQPLQTRIVDQVFLREKMWPIIKQSYMAHDSLFEYDLSDDFPPYGTLAPGQHVGQDRSIFGDGRA